MTLGIIVSGATAYSYSQSPNIITSGVKITSIANDQHVPVGERTITGTSSDNASTDCTVYADWNNTKPFQKAIATGPGGVNDYSNWTFTYTPEYHVITDGTNNLTSKLSCVDDSNNGNLTKYHNLNVTGVVAMSSTAISGKNEQHRQQLASSSSFKMDNRTSRDNNAAVNRITITSNISKPSLPLPIVAQNSNLSAANSINLTGATAQIASEEQQPAVTAAATTIIPPPSPTTKTSSASPIVQPCCPSDGYIANAGPDQTMLEGTIVTLNGGSNNINNNKSSNVGNPANYLWRQTNGPVVILNGNNTAHPSFVAPNYPNDTKYTFALEISQNQVVNNNNGNNNNNQTGSAIDTVDILVKDINAISKKGGSFRQQVSSPSNKSESQTQLFSAAAKNTETYDENKYDNESDSSSSAVATAVTANHQYDQGKEKIEKVKQNEKADTASVTQDTFKGSNDKEDEQEKQKSYDESKHKSEEKEESESQIEEVKEKEKTEENYHTGSGSSSNSDSDIIDNNIISFSINNNNNYDTHKENDHFNYNLKVKKFTAEMNQRIEKLKDRLEYFLKER